ncbi:hypothetical protein EsCd1HHP049_03233 [Escherichia sp. HH154_1D]|nr:hypothetical protein EsCd1HHP049_03233 [Escherichia sp. HH154_1D]
MVGFSLIIMPDMTRYAGDGAGIKAITGGDKVAIDPKHKAPLLNAYSGSSAGG